MKNKIIIRADGGSSIGMGHVIRCIALADMLKNDFTIVFAIQEPKESVIKNIHSVTETIIHLPLSNDYHQDAIHFAGFLEPTDIVILDGYNFQTDYQKIIKEKGCKLVAIDDLHSWHHLADVIINHADEIDEKVYSKEATTRLCLGLDFALLRKEFLSLNNSAKKINAVKKIFISMGAADPNNVTQKFTEALLLLPSIEEIHLMLGSINPNLSKIDTLISQNTQIKIIKHFEITAAQLSNLLNQCDIAICPASSISLEASAIGIGIISGYTAENQKGILNGLCKNKVAVNIGDMNILSISEIKIQLEQFFNSPEQFTEQIKNQKKMIDGNSPKRFRELFKDLVSPHVHFRFAQESDVDLYFQWVNDEFVRKNSFNQDLIPYENHVKWFNSKVHNPDYSFYLFFDDKNQPVGQVRIEKKEDENIVDISIDKQFRGKSLGTIILTLACSDYLNKFPLKTIHSYIKKENQASYSIFKKANFIDVPESNLSESNFLKLCLKNS